MSRLGTYLFVLFMSGWLTLAGDLPTSSAAFGKVSSNPSPDLLSGAVAKKKKGGKKGKKSKKKTGSKSGASKQGSGKTKKK